MLQDLRLALRTLRKRVSSNAVAVVMLALGVGANAVVFSLVQAFLLRPLEFADAESLVRLYGIQKVAGGDRLRVSEGAFFDWRRLSRSFETLVAARNTGLAVTGGEQALNPLMRHISEGYFETLGVRPHLGRGFRPQEYRSETKVAILAFGFWQSYFGGDPEVVGRTIELAYEPYEIVGVMPPGHRNPAINGQPVLWMPLVEPAEPDRRRLALVVIGRLAEGVTAAEAGAEMDGVAEELARLHPDTDEGRGVRLLPLHDSLIESIRPALLLLFGAVGFVLLMAATNIANLLLARAVDRRDEIQLRLALGAGRRHLLRQLLAESLVLTALAAGLGLLLAFWTLGPLTRLAPSNIEVPLLDRVQLDGAAVLFTVALALATSLAFGLLPMAHALRRTGARSSGALAAGSRVGRGPGRKRLRSTLVVAEVALSLMLLIGAGLMVRTLSELRGLGLGFEPEGLLTLRTGARGPIYGDPARFEEFHRLVGDGLRALPGVEEVGACEIMPMFASFRPSQPARTAGERGAREGDGPRAIPLRASAGFFRAFGLPLLQGRGFTADDRPDSEPVAVVSRRLAESVWGDDDPVGRELFLGDGGERAVRVVGVAGDLRGVVRSPEPPPIVYLPLAQNPTSSMSHFLRTAADPLALFPEAEQTVWKISRDVPVFLTTSMEQIVRDIEWQPRFTMQLLSGFALFALVLAATGIFAVLSYEVAERRREIGVRVAVGAGRGDILRLVLAGAARLTALGLLIGLAGALVASRLLASQLYGVEATDPVTYGALLVALAAAALVASALPALKATRLDPVEALRCE